MLHLSIELIFWFSRLKISKGGKIKPSISSVDQGRQDMINIYLD